MKKNDHEEMRDLMNNLDFQNIEPDKDAELDYRFHLGQTSYSNPVSLYFAKHGLNCETPIEEGLIHTYPIETTIRYIKSYFNLPSNLIRIIDAENGLNEIMVTIPDVGSNILLMKKAMNLCGYFPAVEKTVFITDNGVRWKEIQFEPRNQDENTEEFKANERYIYHITPSYNEKKILQKGFCPHSKNKMFKYPDRVYFVVGSAKEELADMAQMLYNVNDTIGNTGEYTVFEIDLFKVDEKVKFYNDPNYEMGVFTTDAIRPDCITNIGHIDLSYYNEIEWNNESQEN